MTTQTALQKMREYIATYPDYDVLSQLTIDYTDKVPNCAGLFPGGLVEVSRRTDLLGNCDVDNQYNFALYANFEKSPNEDEGATINEEWVTDFQLWIQQQSILGNAPQFGDDPRTETMTAQNGEIYAAYDEGTALYVIRISVTFHKRYTKEAMNG